MDTRHRKEKVGKYGVFSGIYKPPIDFPFYLPLHTHISVNYMYKLYLYVNYIKFILFIP